MLSTPAKMFNIIIEESRIALESHLIRCDILFELDHMNYFNSNYLKFRSKIVTRNLRIP